MNIQIKRFQIPIKHHALVLVSHSPPTSLKQNGVVTGLQPSDFGKASKQLVSGLTWTETIMLKERKGIVQIQSYN